MSTPGSATPTGRPDAEVALGDVPETTASAAEKGQYVYARYAAQDAHYLGFYQTWSKAVLFLLGKHWIEWSKASRRYSTDTGVPPWRQQPVTNLVYAVYRTLAAKLTKQKPTMEVVPPSGDSDDREAAALGEAVLTHLWRLLGTEAKLQRAIGWFLCTGQVYLRVHWDPEAGKRVPLTVKVPHPTDEQADDVDCPCDADGTPLMTPEGAPDLDGQGALVPEGEVALDIDDPFSVRFDAEATDASDATEVYIARLWSKARAARQFKIEVSALEGTAGGDRETYADLIAGAATGAGWSTGPADAQAGTVGVSQQDALGARCLVIEYYRKPDPDAGRPDGAHWITVGRTKVWPEGDAEAPLPNGFWPPVVPVLDLPIPGQPHAMGVLPQVVPVNEQFNTLDGKILEHNVLMAMGGKWITHPADNGLVITSDPGQHMNSKGYALGFPPKQADIKALPAEIIAERAVLLDKIRTIASLSEAELGQKPEGVSAGRAFLVLQEVTDSALGPALQAFERAIEEIGRRELVVVQQLYREQRLIAIRGDRAKWEVRSFTGADLRGASDVRVQTGSTFPWSKSAQLDVKLNILTTFPGLFTDPQTQKVDQERFAQFMGLAGSGLQTFEADEDPDLVEIQRVISEFETCDPTDPTTVPQLGFWMDFSKHYEGYQRFMKRDYARYLRMSPPRQNAFLAHVRATLTAINEQAALLASASQPPAPPPGAPGADGQPSDPNAQPEAPGMGDMGGGGTMTANERPTLSAGDMASAAPNDAAPAMAGAGA